MPVSDAVTRRIDLARRLVERCPLELSGEIALTGSTARGVADDESDLELNLWADAIPPLDKRIAWLTAAGASDLYAESVPRPDDSYWIRFTLDGIAGEIGWQTVAALDSLLDRIRAGEAADQRVLAEIVCSAVPLRTSGRLAAWQATLAGYSDAVQAEIVAVAVAHWSKPNKAKRLARHGESLALTESLLKDLEVAVRLLYAVHRRWQPAPKWSLTVARTFAPEIVGRINAALSDPSLEGRVDLTAQVCRDVLARVPDRYDVSAAVEVLKPV